MNAIAVLPNPAWVSIPCAPRVGVVLNISLVLPFTD